MWISRIVMEIVLLDDGWSAGQSGFLKLEIIIPSDFGTMMTDRGKTAVDIVPLWLTEIFGMWYGFSGIENLNWKRFGFSFSIYKWAESFVESSCTFFCSSSNGWRKGGEDGGEAPAAWEFVRRKTSIFAVSLSQSISLRKRAQPPEVIAWWPALIGADDLVSSRPFFRERGSFQRISPSLHMAYEKERSRARWSGVREEALTFLLIGGNFPVLISYQIYSFLEPSMGEEWFVADSFVVQWKSQSMLKKELLFTVLSNIEYYFWCRSGEKERGQEISGF